MNRDSASILDAYRFAQLILQFTSGMNKNDFLSEIPNCGIVRGTALGFNKPCPMMGGNAICRVRGDF